MSLLFYCFLLGAAPAIPSGVIRDSASPDGKFDFVIEQRPDGIHYHVETKEGLPVSDDLKSDFGVSRALAKAQTHTFIHWRPDGKFVTLDAGNNRINEDFLILARSTNGFVPLLFDWEDPLKAAKIEELGFGYASFVRWLPDNRIQISIVITDNRFSFIETRFDLDLVNHLKMDSFKIVRAGKILP